MSRFHSLSLKTVHRETKDAVRLDLEVPAHLKKEFEFRPGQYLTFKMSFDGKEIRRSYSICSSPDSGLLSVAVKEVPGGQFSSHANQNLTAGTQVEVMEPMGEFILKETSGHKVFIAAGSGITPIMSMISSLLAKDEDHQLTLIYGNKGPEEVIFKEKLEDLAHKHADRFKMVYVFSRDGHHEAKKGRVKVDLIEEILSQSTFSSIQELFICGPSAMIFSVKDHFLAKGIASDKVHFELFTAPDKGAETELKHTEKKVKADKDSITFVLDGITLEVEVKNADLAILDIALEAGLDAPFACQGGVCCTCKAKATGSPVDLRQNFSLSDGELKDGYVLTCQSYHQGGQTLIDYDN
jgi:ring-1,2-phenylacetyl-CoA epoxidase subunit PaaE